MVHFSVECVNAGGRMRVVIVPGNGGGNVEYANWYASVRDDLSTNEHISEVILRDMPDSYIARECYWIPFMQDVLKCDENTIVIGHSSGAVAGMRYAESRQLAGLVLVSAYMSHLDDETERQSGYFDRPWQWEKIRNNVGFIAQFGSDDDPFLPWCEQQSVAQHLSSDFKQFNDRGHFQNSTFPELVKTVESYVVSRHK